MGWGVHDYPGPPPEEPLPTCPVCGEECDTIYLNADREAVGCENCICTTDSYIWKENNA